MCFEVCNTGYMFIDIYINDTQYLVHQSVIYMYVYYETPRDKSAPTRSAVSSAREEWTPAIKGVGVFRTSYSGAGKIGTYT